MKNVAKSGTATESKWSLVKMEANLSYVDLFNLLENLNETIKNL